MQLRAPCTAQPPRGCRALHASRPCSAATSAASRGSPGSPGQSWCPDEGGLRRVGTCLAHPACPLAVYPVTYFLTCPPFTCLLTYLTCPSFTCLTCPFSYTPFTSPSSYLFPHLSYLPPKSPVHPPFYPLTCLSPYLSHLSSPSPVPLPVQPLTCFPFACPSSPLFLYSAVSPLIQSLTSNPHWPCFHYPHKYHSLTSAHPCTGPVEPWATPYSLILLHTHHFTYLPRPTRPRAPDFPVCIIGLSISHSLVSY